MGPKKGKSKKKAGSGGNASRSSGGAGGAGRLRPNPRHPDLNSFEDALVGLHFQPYFIDIMKESGIVVIWTNIPFETAVEDLRRNGIDGKVRVCGCICARPCINAWLCIRCAGACLFACASARAIDRSNVNACSHGAFHRHTPVRYNSRCTGTRGRGTHAHVCAHILVRIVHNRSTASPSTL